MYMSAFNKMLFRIFVKLILFYHYQLENYNSFANNCQQQAFPSCNIEHIHCCLFVTYEKNPAVNSYKRTNSWILFYEKSVFAKSFFFVMISYIVSEIAGIHPFNLISILRFI